MFGEKDAQSPHDAFFYYASDYLNAVRAGKWKLHVAARDEECPELYNMEEDIGETNNVHGEHPDVVKELEVKLQACREDIGDNLQGMEGANCRPIGRIDNPKTLTEYDETHPYTIAMYDLADIG